MGLRAIACAITLQAGYGECAFNSVGNVNQERECTGNEPFEHAAKWPLAAAAQFEGKQGFCAD